MECTPKLRSTLVDAKACHVHSERRMATAFDQQFVVSIMFQWYVQGIQLIRKICHQLVKIYSRAAHYTGGLETDFNTKCCVSGYQFSSSDKLARIARLQIAGCEHILCKYKFVVINKKNRYLEMSAL